MIASWLPRTPFQVWRSGFMVCCVFFANAMLPVVGPLLPSTLTFLTTSFSVYAAASVPAQQAAPFLAAFASAVETLVAWCERAAWDSLRRW